MSDIARLKVETDTTLVRDTFSKAIINTSSSSYTEYMNRRAKRQNNGDEIRHAVTEINSLKKELFEIKTLLKEVIGKNNGS
jgi:hypothetical protein|tara:strand:- start:836 stop:1078 length:243 start_codon:yes stop_codon:yes gene_type:complete